MLVCAQDAAVCTAGLLREPQDFSAFSAGWEHVRYSSRQALEGVIERAGRLAGSPLLKQSAELDLHWSPPDPPRVTAPDQAGIDAAVRIARQFMRPDDPHSFQSLAARLDDDPDISAGFKRELAKLIRQLHAGLDQPPPMRFKVQGEAPPTYQEILDVFLHGAIERVAQARRDPLVSWLAQPTRRLLVRSQLQSGLADVCKAIQKLQSLSQRELLRAAG